MITIHVWVLFLYFFSIGVAWYGAGYTIGKIRSRRKHEKEEVDKNLRLAYHMLEWMENTYLQDKDIGKIFQEYLKYLDSL